MVEVRIISITRPDITNEILTSFTTLNEGIQFFTSSSCIRLDSDTNIDDATPVHTFRLTQIIDILHLLDVESGSIQTEIVEFVHVVDIRPERIHRDAEIVEFIPDVVKILGSIVAPSALMITLSPERMENPAIDVVVVELDGFFRIFITNEELEVEISTDHFVCEFLVFSVIDFHAISVSEEDDVELLACSVSAHVHRVGTVDLLARLAVVNTCGISCPDGVLSRVKLEGSSSLSKSENSSILEICGDFEVLILEDERAVGGIEEYFTSVLTPDLQVELISWDTDYVFE